MTASGDWLAARLADAPDSLRDAVRRSLPEGQDASGGGYLEILEAAAEELIRFPPAAPDPHGNALNLLAADALMTLACEWVADRNPAALGALR